MSSQELSNSPTTARRLPPVLKYIFALIGLFICLWSIRSAGQMGLSRMTGSFASAKNLLPAADEAVAFSPLDPEAHYLRASMLSTSGDLNEGMREYERAVALRPLDYVLWLSLGSARDENDDAEGALLAFTEAVRLSPAYAEPHWQLGNLLLRMNRTDEAFAEMRTAAISQPTLLPNFIDLVWSTSGGDVSTVARVIRPETDAWRLTLARFFVKRGKASDALSLFRAAGEASAEDRRALLNELLAAKQFTEAYQVWKSGEDEKRRESAGEETALITDGGFESGVKVNEAGFGWQLIPSSQMIRLSLDRAQPHSGSNSLLIDWSGNVDAGSPVLSQLVLVEPGTRYQLTFAFRTSELTTGGPPVLTVNDASSQDAHEMARSTPLPKDTGGWQEQRLDLTTAAETRAILIKVIRQNCSAGPCPIFGRLWLDDFSMRKWGIS